MHKWTLVKEIEVRSKASDIANNLTDISQWCSKNRWHGDELTVVVGMSRPSVKWYYVCWRLDWSIEDWRHKVRVTTQLIWVNMTDMSQSRREVKWCDHRLIVVVTPQSPYADSWRASDIHRLLLYGSGFIANATFWWPFLEMIIWFRGHLSRLHFVSHASADESCISNLQ